MKTIGIFTGSFNKFHIGHLDILNKSKSIFGEDNVIVAIGINPGKNEEDNGRFYELKKKLGNVESYSGFTHEYIEEKEKLGFNVVLIRGIRDEKDFIYENLQLKYMKDFKPDIKYVFIQCSEEYNHISSSGIKQLDKIKKGSGDKYIF